MAHTDRPLMSPQPMYSFNDVYQQLLQSGKTNLHTESRVPFTAEAKSTQDGRLFIALSHNNRIYSCCWGNTFNHMGKQGQRIGHYTKTLDKWSSVAKNS